MASLPVSRLDQLQIPGMNADVGSPAQVITGAQEGSPLRRRGRILRLSGQLDPATRSAKVVVVVDNPFDVPAKALPLLPGSFVDVELEGEEEQVIPIPQAALHERTQVWLVNGQLELEERTVAIGWRNEGQAYVTEGLTGGERLVISPLASPRAGLRVRAEPLLTRVESGR
jgi:multidrug efflux pump subunit AcrA (membrane-fusion protein)